MDYGYNDTGEAGTPALPMDIEYFEGDLYDLTYRFDLPGDTEVKASIYASELDHGMTNYHLRQPPEPANWRRNIATSDNIDLVVDKAFQAGGVSIHYLESKLED